MTERIYYSREAEALAKRQRVVSTITYFTLGLGIGAALALLFAPNEGERMRRLLANALEEGFQRGRERTSEALNELEREYPELRQKVEGILGKVSNLN